MTQDFWVLHSPYPDGSWRGIEKCWTPQPSSPIKVSPCSGPMLFEEKEHAEQYMRDEEVSEKYFKAVKVTLTFPDVGEKDKKMGWIGPLVSD